MKCPDCGVEMTLPDSPGPIACDCNPGWYLMGALKDPEETTDPVTGTSEVK
jgi:hypothetical protein